MKLTPKSIGSYRLYISILMLFSVLFSCKKFVDVPSPEGMLDWERTFNNDGSATAAVLEVYPAYDKDVLPLLSYLSGLAADELNSTSPASAEFLNNSISIANTNNSNDLWANSFSNIRKCNLAIEGMNRSTNLSVDVKRQLSGEMKFMRAALLFNLLNLYGKVPLPLSVDELENAQLPRAGTAEVWSQIIADLQSAKELLKAAYPSGERARVNKYAASALLARVYLYHSEWVKAETEASEVIGYGLYSLSSPEGTFKKNSNETILQLYTQVGRSPLATNYVPGNAGLTPRYFLRKGFDLAFEKNGTGIDDLRKTNWTGKNNAGIYYVNKYKVLTGAGDEYSILLRLAELYLIRAEARAQQNKLNGSGSAETDLNIIRTRAGLESRTGLTQADMLAAVEQERKLELFGEYPHRWFDLKRAAGFTDASKSRADEVLMPLKGAFWQSTDVLFPIPSTQIRVNPALDQNPGY